MNAQQIYNRGNQWIDDNPNAWNFIVRRALEECEKGRIFTVQSLMEEARRKDFAPKGNERFKINNSFEPFFARKLLCDYPQLGACITLRKSRIDECFAAS